MEGDRVSCCHDPDPRASDWEAAGSSCLLLPVLPPLCDTGRVRERQHRKRRRGKSDGKVVAGMRTGKKVNFACSFGFAFVSPSGSVPPLAALSFSVVSCFPFRCIRRGGGEDGETSDSWSRRNQSLSLSQPRIEERSVPFSLLSPPVRGDETVTVFSYASRCFTLSPLSLLSLSLSALRTDETDAGKKREEEAAEDGERILLPSPSTDRSIIWQSCPSS